MSQSFAAAPTTLNNEALIAFLFAGDAIFTLANAATDQRFTYRVTKKAYTFTRNGRDVQGTCYWVSLLTGPHNLSDYTFLGSVKDETVRAFALSPKSRVQSAHLPSVQAINWLLGRIQLFEQGRKATVMTGLDFYHCGRCARCARVLTVPTSIESGFGPECQGFSAKGIVKHLKVAQL